MIRVRSTKTRLLLWGGAAGTFLALCFALWQGILALGWRGGRDYSARPPLETFKWVTGRPVPPGLTSLCIAGRSYLGGMKHWVWMSFDATDAAIKAVVGKEHRLDASSAEKLIQSHRRVSVDPRYDAQDKAWVRWDEVERIPDAEIYLLPSDRYDSDPFVWAGILIVDRKAHRGYIVAQGD